jgi:ABC-type amino acid transport system permease subunit
VSAGFLNAGVGWEGARWQVMAYVVLPQAVRIIIPPLGNTVISMLKDSSLVAIIAVSDPCARP